MITTEDQANALLKAAEEIVALEGVHADESWHVQHTQYVHLCSINAYSLASALLEAVEVIESAHSWLARWAQHAGNCRGDERCTCGLVAIRTEAATFLARQGETAAKIAKEKSHEA